jgi:hypothetical protein
VLLGNWPDGTSLAGVVQRPLVIVTASGIEPSLAELGEQVCWMAAALRPSLLSDRMSRCKPAITGISSEKVLPTAQSMQSYSETSYDIEFDMEVINPWPNLLDGQCWHAMFRNPVLVEGYPILPRSKLHTGVEIQLNVMLAMMETRRVDRFAEKTFVKGFSAMLVPTRRIENTIHWHFLCNKDGNRMSYLDVNIHHECVDNLELDAMRHFIGWCSEAQFYTGTTLLYL